MNKETFYGYFGPHTNGSGGFRAMIPILNGKLEMSVVAGQYYYCQPRQDEEKPQQYSKMELAIFKKGGDDWASWDEINTAGIFKIIGYGEHPEEYTEGKSDVNVWGYVPVEELLKIASL